MRKKWLPSARPQLAFRTKLILLLVAIVVLATTSLGSIAFQTSRKLVEESGVRAVGIVASARKQALFRFLDGQRVRVGAVLETVSVGCAPEEAPCIRRILTNFANSEGVDAVEVTYRKRPPVIVGDASIPFREIDQPTEDQVARFVSDGGRRYYVIQVRRVFRDGEMVGTLRGNMAAVNSIFGDRYGLEQSGDTFLVDANGEFLTPLRYPTPGGRVSARDTAAIRTCLQGKDQDVLDTG